MTAASVVALLREVLLTLPAAVTTGKQVIDLVNESYRSLLDAIADREVDADEIDALVAQIIANSAAIQGTD
jgi:hypothetical protein